jgi:hypothetical protein
MRGFGLFSAGLVGVEGRVSPWLHGLHVSRMGTFLLVHTPKHMHGTHAHGQEEALRMMGQQMAAQSPGSGGAEDCWLECPWIQAIRKTHLCNYAARQLNLRLMGPPASHQLPCL